MIILVIFILIPFVLATAIEYAVCRFPRRRWWRVIPPLAVAAVAAAVGVGRYNVWTSQNASPWTQLLFVPGLPALFAFLGFLAGWRLWRRLWRPRVVRDKFKR